MLVCSACRQEKPEECFNRNQSSKRGRDCYCTQCRAEYHKNGRTWPDASERATEMITRGVWKCSKCKQEKAIDQFYQSDSYRYGISDHCKQCVSNRNKVRYADPVVKDRRREYYLKPDVAARTEARRRETPRQALSIRLNKALKRRPTDNPITLDQLMELWHEQEGQCAVSKIHMTWAMGETTPTSISIDRIDSDLGYTLCNVRLICTQVNIFKGRWSDVQMVKMAKAIVAEAMQREIKG